MSGFHAMFSLGGMVGAARGQRAAQRVSRAQQHLLGRGRSAVAIVAGLQRDAAHGGPAAGAP
jgi:hypothetical protein